MRLFLGLILSFGLVNPAFPGEKCETQLPHKPYKQPNGPRCLAAAAATVLSGQGATLNPTEIARLVPVWPDGIDAFDLQQNLKKRGWESLVFTGPAESAARLVEAGFGVVSMVRDGRGKHAVAVVGSKRTVNSEGRCGSDLAALRIFNPRLNKHSWRTTEDFEAAQFAQQHIVFFRAEQRSQLTKAGFPIKAAEKVDRRFRASALIRRARKHGEINKQALRLAEMAVAADPEWDQAVELLARFRQALTRP
jgi:hypothetical protein